MKPCTKCGVVKPLDEYYRNNSTKDGRSCRCAVCLRAEKREEIAQHPDRVHKRKKRYYDSNREAVVQRVRDWREKNRQRSRDVGRKYREKNADQVRLKARQRYYENLEASAARGKIARALKKGILTRPDQCSHCNAPCKPDGHHEDYNDPFDVIWLCRKCHRRHHGMGLDAKSAALGLSK